MTFKEEDLTNYISKAIVPKEAMIKLNELLFKELNEYCGICEDDRMVCVLSPMCPKRILIKVRIQSGANLDDLPKFCYSQAVNNIKRYLNKNTTLYSPQDELIYNEDFIDIMFPRLQKKITQNYNTNLTIVHEAIENSKIPAVHLNIRNADRDIFEKIINKDKIIRDRTFIYDILNEFLIIWYEGAIFITNFNTGITIVNARNDIIDNINLIEVVFNIYCSEQNITANTTINGENHIKIVMKLPFTQIHEKKKDPQGDIFQSFIHLLQDYFFEIKLSLDSENNFIISLYYQNSIHFLERNHLNQLSYNSIRQIINNIDNLRKEN